MTRSDRAARLAAHHNALTRALEDARRRIAADDARELSVLRLVASWRACARVVPIALYHPTPEQLWFYDAPTADDLAAWYARPSPDAP